MKISKICALVLALVMIVPFIAACSAKKDGTPVAFGNVTIITTYDQSAGEEAEDTEEEAETAAPVEDEDFEETLFGPGEVVVYVKDEANVDKVTLKDVLLAYGDAENKDVTIDEHDIVKRIGDISVFSGYSWSLFVNGSEMSLDAIVNPEDEIQIIFQK